MKSEKMNEREKAKRKKVCVKLFDKLFVKTSDKNGIVIYDDPQSAIAFARADEREKVLKEAFREIDLLCSRYDWGFNRTEDYKQLKQRLIEKKGEQICTEG